VEIREHDYENDSANFYGTHQKIKVDGLRFAEPGARRCPLCRLLFGTGDDLSIHLWDCKPSPEQIQRRQIGIDANNKRQKAALAKREPVRRTGKHNPTKKQILIRERRRAMLEPQQPPEPVKVRQSKPGKAPLSPEERKRIRQEAMRHAVQVREQNRVLLTEAEKARRKRESFKKTKQRMNIPKVPCPQCGHMDIEGRIKPPVYFCRRCKIRFDAPVIVQNQHESAAVNS